VVTSNLPERRLRRTLGRAARYAIALPLGTTIPPRQTARGLYRWWRGRRAYDGAVDTAPAARLRDQGFSELPGALIDAPALTAVQRRFAEIIDDDRYARPRWPLSYRDVADELLRAHGIDERSGIRRDVDDVQASMPQAMSLLTPGLLEALRSVARHEVRVEAVRAWRTFHLPPAVSAQAELYADRWHFDGHAIDTLKLFILLSDTDDRHGPLELIPRRASRWLVARGYDGARRMKSPTGGLPSALLDEHPQRVRLRGPAGTTLLVRPSLCLHRHAPAEPGTRRDMLQFILRAATEPCPPGPPLG
jgi:hypothetical protein